MAKRHNCVFKNSDTKLQETKEKQVPCASAEEDIAIGQGSYSGWSSILYWQIQDDRPQICLPCSGSLHSQVGTSVGADSVPGEHLTLEL